MTKETFDTYSPEETFSLGRALGEKAEKGSVFCLVGDLGVGKTIFTKGFAAGLGIDEPVTSPTFTIINVYDSGRLPFYHFDVYRIGDIDELEEIGYEEYFFGEGVTFVEWANFIEEAVPNEAVWITIKKDLSKGLDYRSIEVG